MTIEYFKHLLIRTPLERPARLFQDVARSLRSRKNPELKWIRVEPKVLDVVLERALRRDSHAVDVGCHLGTTLSRIVGLAPEGHHIAIEAEPKKARWLRQKFPEVDIHATAVADTAGERSFFVNPSRSGYSGLRIHDDRGQSIEKLTVPCNRLDDLIPEDRRITFLKIDIEGAELSALRGAERLLHRDKPIVLFESTRSGHAAHETQPSALFDLLTGWGYDVLLPQAYVEGGERLERDDFVKAHEYPFRAFNFVARPREDPLR